MFEWFFAPYAGLLRGIEFLLRNPIACSAVGMLRALTLLLCAAAGARIVAHCVADRRLRLRSPVYGRDEVPGLYDLYREAAARAGVKHLPPLRRQGSEDPLAFTTGCFRPAVFVAPTLVRSLGTDELRAVLVHELIHVRRRDNLRALVGSLLPIGALVILLQAAALHVLLFQIDLRFGYLHASGLAAAVLALLWVFRSVAWPLMVFRRELSCDDRVVEVLQNPLVVAASLVKVWRLQRALPSRTGGRWIHAQALLRTRPSIEARVRRLIDYQPDPRRVWITGVSRALTAAALVWLTLFLWTYHGPQLRALVVDAPTFSLTQQ